MPDRIPTSPTTLTTCTERTATVEPPGYGSGYGPRGPQRTRGLLAGPPLLLRLSQANPRRRHLRGQEFLNDDSDNPVPGVPIGCRR